MSESSLGTSRAVLANVFGGWEIFIVLGVILLLFGASRWHDPSRGTTQGFKDFCSAVRAVRDRLYEALRVERSTAKGVGETKINSRSQWILWLAQGFGVGRVPVAPGTFGSLVGLMWFLLLLLPESLWFFAAAIVVSTLASVSICGDAEKMLNQSDPGSVVLDEIVALPLCFGWWVGLFYFRHGRMPSPDYFFNVTTWPLTLGVFFAFRLFDVWKPWPVRQTQQLPGGWGVTIDDVLAALYVNLASVIALGFPAIANRTGSNLSP